MCYNIDTIKEGKKVNKMIIVKTEKIHISKKEFEAFELVSRVVSRCKEYCESPIIKINAEEVDTSIENFFDYVVPDFTLGDDN